MDREKPIYPHSIGFSSTIPGCAEKPSHNNWVFADFLTGQHLPYIIRPIRTAKTSLLKLKISYCRRWYILWVCSDRSTRGIWWCWLNRFQGAISEPNRDLLLGTPLAVDISKIEIDLRSRDEIPKLLLGLQFIYGKEFPPLQKGVRGDFMILSVNTISYT